MFFIMAEQKEKVGTLKTSKYKKRVKRGLGCCFGFLMFIFFFVVVGTILTLSGYTKRFICSSVVENSYLWNEAQCTVSSVLNVDDKQTQEINIDVDNSSIPVGDVPGIVKSVEGGVVGIGVKGLDGELEILGTGFVVSKNGYIVTNQHVVSEGQNIEYYVAIQGEESPVEVNRIHRDRLNDIAILEIDPKFGKNALTLYQGDLKVGQEVIAIGNPLGKKLSGTVTKGIISGLHRSVEIGDGEFFYGGVKSFENVIQTDAAINPGNSGGPLLDLKGRVVGINFATVEGADNLSFALPIDRVVQRLNELKQYGEFRMPYIGIKYKEKIVFMKDRMIVAAIVVNVATDSPAEKVGLVKGDIIVGIDSEDFSEKSLAQFVQEKNIGDKVTLNVLRNKKIVNIELEIGSRGE